MDIQTEKRVLRQSLRIKRQQVHASAVGVAEGLNTQFFKMFQPSESDVVGGFWPIQSEPDTRLLLDNLQRRGTTVALPYVDGPFNPLRFKAWHPNNPLTEGPHGIPQPAENTPTLIPNLVMVPCFTVDQEGFRIGYGTGYYDLTLRHLSTLGQKPVSIAVCYEEMLEKSIPREPHDFPMDYSLTPLRCHKF